jgi:hypothetical protein
MRQNSLKIVQYVILTAVGAYSILFVGAVQAQQPLPRESGFSGYFEILGAYISTNSQLNTDSENKKTDSLDSAGERVGSFKPLPLGLIAYTFADIRTQLYLGTLPQDIAQGQFFVEAGVRHDLLDGTILRASVIPISPIEQETWKDPFVVGQNRKKTDITSFGFKLAVENIRRLGLSFRYGWVHQNIDDEESGTFLFSQLESPLTCKDLDDLDRDSNFHRLTAEYTFKLMPRLRLRPILRYTRGDAEGDANSFYALTPQLSFLYFGNHLQATLNIIGKGEWYDDTHPVFDKTRRDYNLGLFAILGYKDPFGLKNFRIDWFNAFFESTSNINFYESTNYLSALGIGNNF